MANEIKNLRTGNLTSSEIVNITSDGRKKGEVSEKFWTYIGEANMERRLGKSIDSDGASKETAWGKIAEYYVQQDEKKLGMEYTIMGKQVYVNPVIPYHVGSPDCTKKDTVGEQKSPFTYKSFCQLVDPLYYGLTGMDAMNSVRNGFYSDKNGKAYLIEPDGIDCLFHKKHEKGEQFYQQIVSNAILTGSKYGELIVFMPYASQVSEVKDCGQYLDEEDQNNFVEMICNLIPMDDLPHLEDGGFYKDLNIISFEIPQADKQHLIQRLELAGKYLIKI